MTLSVIIPVYGVEHTLDRCVESVVRQTFDDWEIILVDDGSPDDSPRLCDEWAARDSRIHVIHQENGGLSSARNAGIDSAQGRFITFLDSDDYLDIDTYRHAIPLMDQADIVEFPFYRFFGSQRQCLVSFSPTTYTDMRTYWLKGHAYEHCYVWNKVFRRELFAEVRFPIDYVFEDVAMMPLLLARAHTVVTTDAGLYYYCANDAGITATATGRELNMLLEAHLQQFPKWVDDRYYMHVLNIQLDVCRLTDLQPRLPLRRVNPFAKGLTFMQRLKAILVNILGIKGLCRINKIRN